MKLPSIFALVVLFISSQFNVSAGTGSGDANRPLANEPTVSANFSFSTRDRYIQVDIAPGDGENRLVVIRKGNTLTAQPVDGSTYLAYSQFGLGSNLGNLSYVVGTSGTTVQVYNLEPNTEYSVGVFEYNGTGNGTNYFQAGSTVKVVRTRFSPPTQSASNLQVSDIQPTSFRFNANPGNGTARLVTVRQGNGGGSHPNPDSVYSPNSVFGEGSLLGAGVYAASFGTPVEITGLTMRTNYTVFVYEFNGMGSGTSYGYDTTKKINVRTGVSAPVVAASNFQVTEVTTSSVRISFTPGSGDSRILYMRKDTLPAQPAANTFYQANAAFGLGSDIGNQTYVISDTGSSVLITGLQSDSRYVFSVSEYNADGARVSYLNTGWENPNYFRTNAFPPAVIAPTEAASGLSVSEIDESSALVTASAGNGLRRLVIVSKGNVISRFPAEDSIYTTDTVYGQGGRVDSLTFAVGDTAVMKVGGLTPNTQYTVSVVEYNTNGELVRYLLNGNPVHTFTTTISRPDVKADTIVVLDIDTTSANISYTSGNGSGALVIVREGNAGPALPVDNQQYAANASFGTGYQIAPGSFVVQAGRGSVVVTGLKPGTQYAVAVIEYNSAGNDYRYLSDDRFVVFRTKARDTIVTPPPPVPVDSLQGISVMGNPVTDNIVRISFDTNETGTLHVQLLSASGMPFRQTTVDIVPGTAEIRFALPASTPRGYMFVQAMLNGRRTVVRILVM
ncbi:MAG: hypothetical protein EOO09_13270 [Chitinophagaceae bacterium]|nr:MAG: hypothetical protein EOO09_13270 [Chitinophagaceae bacterium]